MYTHRVNWDVLIACLVIYLSFSIPYSIAFSKGKETNILTYAMDAIFWVSLVSREGGGGGGGGASGTQGRRKRNDQLFPTIYLYLFIYL